MNKYLWICLLSLVAISCTTQDLDDVADENNTLVLTVNCAAPNSSRAEEKDGETDRNENLIRSLHYFFYHEGKTDVNAVYSGTVTMAETTQKEALIRIPMNENVLNQTIFPRPANNCEVYVIANLPAGTAIPDNTSIESLKQMVVETDFKSADTQSSFIMEGQGIASVIDRNKVQAASGTIPMDRLAAKLTVRISLDESYTDTKTSLTWIPVKESLKVSLRNASSNTTIGGSMGNKLFSYEERGRKGTLQENEVTRYLFDPFYSYPREWEFRSPDALAFYVSLPWKCEDEGTEKFEYCYYKVFPNTTQLTPNNWYNIDLNIGVLGTFNQNEEPVVVENLTYQVVDWKNGYAAWESGKETNAELLDTRYLVVEENEYVVNNQNEFVIPFITSHACSIENLKVERANFIKSDSKVNYDDLTAQAVSGKWITLDASTNTIQLKHALNNNFSSTTNKEYDFTPYIFTFILRHADDSKFSEPITIVQNPALTIEAKLNSTYVSSSNSGDGYRFVNGDKNGQGLGGVHGLEGSNSNPNMYVISTTVLPDNSELILGDPRSSEIHPYASSESAPAVEGGQNRNMSYYHATISDATVQNMISPKFRIASSYGKTTEINYVNAQNRCATYQEDGYPAGRWRVPTMGEVKFIIKLSADGIIPTLFTENSEYWCANGTVTPNNNGGYSTSTSFNNNTTNAVRCVYDEWYWEKSDYPRLPDNKKGTFTWGDEQ